MTDELDISVGSAMKCSDVIHNLTTWLVLWYIALTLRKIIDHQNKPLSILFFCGFHTSDNSATNLA